MVQRLPLQQAHVLTRLSRYSPTLPAPWAQLGPRETASMWPGLASPHHSQPQAGQHSHRISLLHSPSWMTRFSLRTATSPPYSLSVDGQCFPVSSENRSIRKELPRAPSSTAAHLELRVTWGALSPHGAHVHIPGGGQLSPCTLGPVPSQILKHTHPTTHQKLFFLTSSISFFIILKRLRVRTSANSSFLSYLVYQ